ncbi:MAG: YbjQ family protein [Rhodobacteraceae bacterium]|nr:YbjQ family protein [Paracoccaceae bacterium]
MIVTTTPSVEGRQIISYHGIAVGEEILGYDNLGRSPYGISYKPMIDKARKVALGQMQDSARAMGATAVVGVNLDYRMIKDHVVVLASGTAVTLG